MSSQMMVRTNITFNHYLSVFEHIHQRLLADNIVKESYLAALTERELQFPTGIQLENHAIAIPHCDAEHANQPALYLIRPDKPVAFHQADGEGMVQAELIIALVVTDPKQQLAVLRQLFTQLQDDAQVKKLLSIPSAELTSEFNVMMRNNSMSLNNSMILNK